MRTIMLFADTGARSIQAGALLVLVLTPFNLQCQNNVRCQIDGSFDASAAVLSATVTISEYDGAVGNGSLCLDLPFHEAITIRSVTGPRVNPLPYDRPPGQSLLAIEVPSASGNEQVTVAFAVMIVFCRR